MQNITEMKQKIPVIASPWASCTGLAQPPSCLCEMQTICPGYRTGLFLPESEIMYVGDMSEHALKNSKA